MLRKNTDYLQNDIQFKKKLPKLYEEKERESWNKKSKLLLAPNNVYDSLLEMHTHTHKHAQTPTLTQIKHY